MKSKQAQTPEQRLREGYEKKLVEQRTRHGQLVQQLDLVARTIQQLEGALHALNELEVERSKEEKEQDNNVVEIPSKAATDTQ